MMDLSTFAALAACIIGGAGVSYITWRNAQATRSIAHVLHATETAPPQ